MCTFFVANGRYDLVKSGTGITQTTTSVPIFDPYDERIFEQGASSFQAIDGTAAAPSYAFSNSPTTGMFQVGNALVFSAAADIIQQRRGVNPQTFQVFSTFTDASNYERFRIITALGTYSIGVEAAGTGVGRSLQIVTPGNLFMAPAGGVYMSVDNTNDFGAFGANRARNLYVGSAIFTTAPTAQAAGTYTVIATDNTVINSVASTLTLPAVGSSTGRKLRVVTTGANAIISNASNVVPITGGAAGTAILAATAGKWADLECNGTNWIITAAN